jgi:hypothetical protein
MFDYFVNPDSNFNLFIAVSTVGSIITSAALRSSIPTLGITAYNNQFQDPSFRFTSELR